MTPPIKQTFDIVLAGGQPVVRIKPEPEGKVITIQWHIDLCRCGSEARAFLDGNGYVIRCMSVTCSEATKRWATGPLAIRDWNRRK